MVKKTGSGLKYLICSPPYNEKVGGIIFLHHLCHLINKNGGDAYLFPLNTRPVKIYGAFKALIKKYLLSLFRVSRKYKKNESFTTPLAKKLPVSLEKWIVVYPEIVSGNPLKAKNVVRWLLHKPGFQTGEVNYSSGELYFKVHSGFGDFCLPGSLTSEHLLSLRYFPLNQYNEVGISFDRAGSAYLIKKGIKRTDLPNNFDGPVIDNLTHQEISGIFKKTKVFVSFDLYSAYSKLAVLCGCDSVVIPMEGISEESWFPNPEDRFGIAYGFDNLNWARATRAELLKKIFDQDKLNSISVRTFMAECESYFTG
jgi:hypothetical protein